MLGRFLTVLPVMTFVLTLVLATPALAQADLTVEKTDNPDPVVEGNILTYTIVVRNTGEDPATDVVLADDLPDSTRFVDVSTTSGNCDPEPPEGATGPPVTCNLGDLGPNESATVRIDVRAREIGLVSNTATATSPDDTGTNSDSSNTRVIPDLVINKLDDPDPVRREGLLLYTLRVTNEGRSDADNVVIIDDLPTDEVDFKRVDSEDFTCEEEAGLVRCEGTLDAGETGTVRILVEPEEKGTLQNTAEVRAGRRVIDTDTESTVVQDGASGGNGGGGNGGGGNGGGDSDGNNPPPNDGEPEPLPPDEDKGPLAGGTAIGNDVLVPGDRNCGPNGEFVCIDQIVIETEDCELTAQGEELTITLNDQGTPFRLIDGENVDITIEEDGTIVANGRANLGPLATEFNGGESSNPDRVIIPIPVDQDAQFSEQPNDTFPIISSTGIGGEGCRVAGTSAEDPSDAAGGGGDAGEGDVANQDDNVLDASADDDQYKDDVIVATIPDKLLPNTGGIPLLGLAALGLASAVVGTSVLRAGTRRRG